MRKERVKPPRTITFFTNAESAEDNIFVSHIDVLSVLESHEKEELTSSQFKEACLLTFQKEYQDQLKVKYEIVDSRQFKYIYNMQGERVTCLLGQLKRLNSLASNLTEAAIFLVANKQME